LSVDVPRAQTTSQEPDDVYAPMPRPIAWVARHQGSPVPLGLALCAAGVLVALAADATMSA
jgi:hypothetical protein